MRSFLAGDCGAPAVRKKVRDHASLPLMVVSCSSLCKGANSWCTVPRMVRSCIGCKQDATSQLKHWLLITMAQHSGWREKRRCCNTKPGARECDCLTFSVDHLRGVHPSCTYALLTSPHFSRKLAFSSFPSSSAQSGPTSGQNRDNAS